MLPFIEDLLAQMQVYHRRVMNRSASKCHSKSQIACWGAVRVLVQGILQASGVYLL